MIYLDTIVDRRDGLGYARWMMVWMIGCKYVGYQCVEGDERLLDTELMNDNSMLLYL
jgi:hypothetical protein